MEEQKLNEAYDLMDADLMEKVPEKVVKVWHCYHFIQCEHP